MSGWHQVEKSSYLLRLELLTVGYEQNDQLRRTKEVNGMAAHEKGSALQLQSFVGSRTGKSGRLYELAENFRAATPESFRPTDRSFAPVWMAKLP